MASVVANWPRLCNVCASRHRADDLTLTPRYVSLGCVPLRGPHASALTPGGVASHHIGCRLPRRASIIASVPTTRARSRPPARQDLHVRFYASVGGGARDSWRADRGGWYHRRDADAERPVDADHRSPRSRGNPW